MSIHTSIPVSTAATLALPTRPNLVGQIRTMPQGSDPGGLLWVLGFWV